MSLLRSLLWLAVLASSPAFAQLFGPTPYLASRNTPPGFASEPVNIEDFEDAEISPDFSTRGTIVTPQTVTDSVDYDDGSMNGLGRAAHSLQGTGVIRIDFRERPVAAGLVWTDGPGAVTFEAFDATGASLGVSGPHTLADGSNNGGTAEDRFFGARHVGGISAIEVRASGGIEIDHVQWTVGLAAPAIVGPIGTPNPLLRRQGVVSDLVRLSNGKYLIAGLFFDVGGTSRPAVARLNADGSLDNSFAPVAISGGTKAQLLVDSAGKIYLANGDQLRRLNADGTPDPSFSVVNVAPSGTLLAIALLSDGVVMGGFFNSVNAVSRSRLAKVNLSGGLVDFSSAGANDTVQQLLTVGDDVFVAGVFENISNAAGGHVRRGIAKLAANGVVRPWDAGLSSSAAVFGMASDGASLYIAGIFNSVAGTPRSNLAKLSVSDATLDTAWRVDVNSIASPDIALIGGAVYVSSTNGSTVPRFSNPPSTTLFPKRIAKLSPISGAVDILFSVAIAPNDFGHRLLLTQGDSSTRLFLAGNFGSVNDQLRLSTAQLLANGNVDPVVIPAGAGTFAYLQDIEFDQANQRVYLAGEFAGIDGLPMPNLVRLTNGVVDTTWRPATTEAFHLAFRSGQGLFVATPEGIVRLNETDGSATVGWRNTTQALDLSVSATAVYAASGGALLRFPFANGGVADPGFSAPNSGGLREILFDNSSGSVITVSADARSVQRFDADTGAVDAGFARSFDAPIQGIAIDGRAGLWVAGNFSTMNGQPVVSPVLIDINLDNGGLDPQVLPTPPGGGFNLGLGFHRGHFYGAGPVTGGFELRRIPIAGGAAEQSYKAMLSGLPTAIIDQGNRTGLAGFFDRIGTQPRTGYAELPRAERVFTNGLE